MSNCQHIRCEPYDTCQLNVEIELAYLPRGDGTGGFVDVKAIRALSSYVEQCEDEGTRAVLGCGCTKRVECGYHREQRERVDANGGAE